MELDLILAIILYFNIYNQKRIDSLEKEKKLMMVECICFFFERRMHMLLVDGVLDD